MNSDVLFPCFVVLLGLIIIGGFAVHLYLEDKYNKQAQKETDIAMRQYLENLKLEEHRFDIPMVRKIK